MKIDRATTVPTRRARAGARGRAGGSDDFSKAMDAAGTSPAMAVGGAAPLSGVEALLALQEVAAQPDTDAQGRRRGEELLERLDDLRLALLEGQLSAPAIQRLGAMAASERAQVRDPRLATILDDIELRAAVELAKLGR